MCARASRAGNLVLVSSRYGRRSDDTEIPLFFLRILDLACAKFATNVANTRRSARRRSARDTVYEVEVAPGITKRRRTREKRTRAFCTEK